MSEDSSIKRLLNRRSNPLGKKIRISTREGKSQGKGEKPMQMGRHISSTKTPGREKSTEGLLRRGGAGQKAKRRNIVKINREKGVDC